MTRVEAAVAEIRATLLAATAEGSDAAAAAEAQLSAGWPQVIALARSHRLQPGARADEDSFADGDPVYPRKADRGVWSTLRRPYEWNAPVASASPAAALRAARRGPMLERPLSFPARTIARPVLPSIGIPAYAGA